MNRGQLLENGDEPLEKHRCILFLDKTIWVIFVIVEVHCIILCKCGLVTSVSGASVGWDDFHPLFMERPQPNSKISVEVSWASLRGTRFSTHRRYSKK